MNVKTNTHRYDESQKNNDMGRLDTIDDKGGGRVFLRIVKIKCQIEQIIARVIIISYHCLLFHYHHIYIYNISYITLAPGILCSILVCYDCKFHIYFHIFWPHIYLPRHTPPPLSNYTKRRQILAIYILMG